MKLTNWSKIIVFFIFFSHINAFFSQKKDIITTPAEQTINNGIKEIENNPEIIAEEIKNISNNKIIIMPGSGISNNNLKNFCSFYEIHDSFKGGLTNQLVLVLFKQY